MEQVDLGHRLAPLLSREVVTAVFAGVSDTYMWYVDGPGLQRQLVYLEGTRVHEGGDPVPEEGGLETLDEDTLFGLLRARTGLTDDWLEQTAQPLTWHRAQAPRGLWHRISRRRS